VLSPKRNSPLFIALCLLAPAAPAQTRGQADIALQGYYLGGNSLDLSTTSGASVRFQDFIPRLGLLSGSLEGYGVGGRLASGENFLELRGAPALGYRWNIAAGDFRAAAMPLESPFLNLFVPEITGRGFRVQAGHEDTQYSVFLGQETLTAGPRVSYRIRVPQTIMGATASRRIGPYLRVAVRFHHFAASPQAVAENPWYFPEGRDFNKLSTFGAHALFTPGKRLKVYAEASRPLSGVKEYSSIAGAAWEGKALTLRFNYALQGVAYFPLAGYFTGDRRGPYGEIRYRVTKWLELLAFASRYRNNLQHRPDVTDLESRSASAGFNLMLPGKVSLGSQLSTVRLFSRRPGEAPEDMLNQQLTANLGKTLGRHGLQLSAREFRLRTSTGPERQRSIEFQDMLHFRHFFVGGSVRLQRDQALTRRNSLFVRGMLQANLGRFTAYANIESGNDLANSTVFATNTYGTSMVGVSTPLGRDWSLHAEAFRSKLNIDLNPESLFLLENAGLSIAESLAVMSQWSFYFRITRQIRWGGGLPTIGSDQFTALTAPLNGSVEGVVTVRALNGGMLAPGIPVTIDGGRSATTGPDGHYRFAEVPEGPHEIALSASELPADYDPGTPSKAKVLVQPRRTARTDFEVFPLATIEGRVDGPKGMDLDGTVIRLVPGERYTTANSDGRFVLYNVREGDYELVLDPKTLPDRAELRSEAAVARVVRVGNPIPAISFTVAAGNTGKPIRKVLDRK
jgi:hypothetical protein